MKLKLSLAMLITLSAFAKEDFETMKSGMLKVIDRRMSNLVGARNCVAGSTSKDDLKACRNKMHQQRKEQKDIKKAVKEEKIDKKK